MRWQGGKRAILGTNARGLAGHGVRQEDLGTAHLLLELRSRAWRGVGSGQVWEPQGWRGTDLTNDQHGREHRRRRTKKRPLCRLR